MLRRLLVGSSQYMLGAFGPDSDLRRYRRWKANNKEGRHVGLDFYDPFIEGHYTPSKVARNPFGINEP
jgi:hypothetical protein